MASKENHTKEENIFNRSAGILLHISSLPSKFGIGDMGPEAMKFADFLKAGGQRLWQLLPLNPLMSDPSPSPYSSVSSMAGNPLFISPEILVEEGLLTEEDLLEHVLPVTDKADYLNAERVRVVLLDKAYKAFKRNSTGNSQDFEAYCRKESYWLDDFALYLALKKTQGQRAWFDWPAPYKNRDQNSLYEFAKIHAEELEKVKWQQFIFDRQWTALKNYCNRSQIMMVGDIAFYVGYDSADVWSNREIFHLNTDGQITGVAGVPPDYFNENGQLWGMPVFRWEVLKKNKYHWWIQRLRRNTELFDLVRLDHFLAFVDYYEVPGGHTNAKHGVWKKGPGKDFFKAVQETLGQLPFIVEDLGDVTEEVFELRDELGFPGMKILQFAFGGDMSTTVHIPHHYTTNAVVYTGTHDNNTTIGWFKNETGKQQHKNLKLYTGIKPGLKNIHALLTKLAYSSVALMVIIPLQDVLELDENARMNIPGTMGNNWIWRFLPGQLEPKHKKQLKEWTEIYNR